MSTNINFSDLNDLDRWLSNKSRGLAIMFAARAALRVVPLLVSAPGPRVLPVFRAAATSWVAGQYPTHVAVAPAAKAAARAVAAARDPAAIAAAAAANAAAAKPALVRSYAVDAVAAAAADAADAANANVARAVIANAAAFANAAVTRAVAANAANAVVARAAAADANQIINTGASISALIGCPLWLTEPPTWANDAWRQLEIALLKEGQNWQVWTGWYRARLEGRSANEALEVARVLIADDIWKQGPRVANAEIARLIAEHGDEPDRPAQTHAPNQMLPDVPAQSIAAVNPVWRNRLLMLPAQPTAQELSEAEFISALSGLRDDLREFADDLAGEANIDQRFLSYMYRFADRIPQALPSQHELFRIGHLVEVFLRYASTVDNEWPEFLSVRYHALTVQSERAMRQSPLWRDFKRNAEKATLTAEQIGAAASLAAITANALREGEAHEFVDGPVSAALEDLTQTLQQVSNPVDGTFDAIEAGNELLASDLIESVNNVLKRIYGSPRPH